VGGEHAVGEVGVGAVEAHNVSVADVVGRAQCSEAALVRGHDVVEALGGEHAVLRPERGVGREQPLDTGDVALVHHEAVEHDQIVDGGPVLQSLDARFQIRIGRHGGASLRSTSCI
jgi:hypothetical protein